MNKYVCERCNYSTNRKDYLKNHYNRKTPCSVIKKNITIEECKKNFVKKHFKLKCDYCDKTFASRQGKYQHKKRCKYKLQSENKLLDEKNTNKNTNTIDNDVLYSTLETIISKMLIKNQTLINNQNNRVQELNDKLEKYITNNEGSSIQNVNIVITPYKKIEQALLSEKEEQILNHLGENIRIPPKEIIKAYIDAEYMGECIKIESGDNGETENLEYELRRL